jgi:mRNA-degrading endonuclease RelE of RelBE toxin-antitoxin system
VNARKGATIQLLESAKWAFMTLDHASRHRLARRIERLAQRPRPHDAHLIAGTDHVHRLWERGVRVIYHYREGTITLLIVERHRTERQVDELIARRQRGSSGSGRGTQGGGTLSKKAARPA